MKKENPSPQVYPVYVDEVEVGEAEIPVPPYWVIGVIVGVIALVLGIYALLRR